MVLCCEFSLSLSFTNSSHSASLLFFNRSLSPQALNSSSPDFLFFKLERLGEMGWDGSPLFKRRLSKCLMHYNEKRHLYSHKALSVPVHVCPSSEAEYLQPLSLTIYFPHTSFFFLSRSYPKHPHNTLIFFPFFLSTLEYPVFHLAAQRAVWVFLVSYVTSFLESLPLHNLPATVRQSMRVLFLP